MQLDNIGKRVRLTIAGNHDVPEKVVRNLEAVWTILRDISIHHVERSQVGVGEFTNKKKKKKKKKKDMGKILGSRDPALLRRLQYTIYRFTSKILLSRFNLHQLEFQKFTTAFKKTTSNPNLADQEEHRAVEILIGVINVIEHTLIPLLQKLKLNYYLEESEWEIVCIMMDGVLHDCEHILDNKRFCEKWVIMARDVDKTIPTGFSLRGYLEKITLLHSHIRALVHSAQSLYPTFVKQLSIHPIPAERRTLLLPKTPEKLEALITSVAHQQGYALVNTTFIRKIEHYPSVELKVHCECLLVKHFHTLKNTPEPKPSWNNISPFSYIGVSKLSCQACGSWLKAYRSLGQQSFVTKGIHPKWSRSWGMPQLVNKVEMKQVQEDMARDTARKFCLYQEGRARMVLLSGRAGMPLIKDDDYPLEDGEAVLYTTAKMEKGDTWVMR
ncbi:hypothetical protein Q9L58_002863 [Maublancomyces gigas]|uniref:Uncharacterized protein n=1 Tax=Discina gigas TaxID=1032678 RepID=A0ABR3GQ96_9PEZI